MGYLASDKIVRMGKQEWFKFKYADELFNFGDDNELIELGLRYKVHFKTLVEQIRRKDKEAFKEYLKHEGKIDGAARDIYYETFWKLINDWNDNETYQLISSLDVESRKKFIQIMLSPETTWPIENQKLYYEKYYPTTFQQFLRDR
jgi:hypothetical protein